MAVNTYLYIAIIAASVWSSIVSCSKGSGLAPNDAADSISTLVTKGSHYDISAFRTGFLYDNDSSFRNDVYDLFRDSSLNIRAIALYATHTIDEIADNIFAGHAVDISHAVFQYLIDSGETSSLSQLKSSIIQRFDAMNLDEKAHWIIATLAPSEIAMYLEDGDQALTQRIIALLNQSDKALFVASLKRINN